MSDSRADGRRSERSRPVVVGLDYETDAPWVWVNKDDDLSKLEDEFGDHGGWFVRDVPAELVDRFEQAVRDLDAAVEAVHAAAGYDAANGRMHERCDIYRGESATINGHTFWDECQSCGWRREDHHVK